jgi:mono/diheme cytochrome c family protein
MMEITGKAASSTKYWGPKVLVTAILVLLHSVSALATPQDHSARSIFTSTCASCHGQNGVPTAVGKSLNAPDLSSTAVQKHTTAQLQQIISDGKGNMPPFKGSLSETQIDSLITFIRAFSRKVK